MLIKRQEDQKKVGWMDLGRRFPCVRVYAAYDITAFFVYLVPSICVVFQNKICTFQTYVQTVAFDRVAYNFDHPKKLFDSNSER